MTALAIEQDRRRTVAGHVQAVTILEIFAFTMMVFPSDDVFKPIGGGGYLAGLVAYFLFACYVAALLFGFHKPANYRSPIRVALAWFWIAALVSYALMNRTLLSSEQLSSADRWLIQLVGMTGVILVASEFLRSLDDIHKVLRWLTYGASIAGIAAAMQFWLNLDVTVYIRKILPGFSLNQAVDAVAIGDRAGLNRVDGTAIHPIEMGVVAGMLLPLALYLAMHDTERSLLKRWFPVVCIAVTIPITISRAGVLSALIAIVVFIAALAPTRRWNILTAIPLALGAIFLTAHHLIGTLLTYFTIGTSDNSISHRVDNYPYAFNLISQAPWFGHGGGTYIANSSIANLAMGHILDDEYLDAMIELGVFGVCAFFFFLLWPAVTAIFASVRAKDSRTRELSAALAGAALAGTVCSATFDSLGFPMFVMTESLVIGLCGAVWLIERKGNADDVIGGVQVGSP